MLLLQLFLTLLLLAICSFAPGFVVVRRLPWSALEKLCGAIALSLILLWLAIWGIYVFAPSAQPGAYFAIVAICCAAGAFTWRDARALFRVPRVRRALAGYAFLLAWTLLIVTVIRVYSGALWGGDWLEHFQRTLFFLHHFPHDTPIYGDYLLPARPPMMNVLAALFLGVTQDRFEIFQLVFAFLNLLLFLPCCLAITVVARARRASILPLVAIFALNPAVMQNATYTWTKSLTVFFVILAVCLYLSGWRKRDSVRLAGAFLCLAAGLLVHYSAGPYCVFFALHYLLVVFRTRPNKWKELTAVAASCGFLLLTWFAWSLATYGPKATFASNSSITFSQKYEGNTFEKMAGNFRDSFLPAVIRDPSMMHLFDQPYTPAMVRDNFFVIYQANVIFSMGLIGGPLVVWFLIRAFRSGRLPRAERSFWLCLIGFSVVVGVAVVGERDNFGVGHLTLIPLEVLGLTLLSVYFFKRRNVALAIIAGCAFDFALGIFLHVRIENLENTPAHRYYSGMSVNGGRFLVGEAGPDSLGGGSWHNWFTKRQPLLCLEWLETEERYRPGDPTLEAGRVDLRGAMREYLQEDESYWQGWYRRHGGQIGFIGDWFGDNPATSIVMVLAAIGLLWKLARIVPAAVSVPRAAAKPKSSRSRRKR